MADVLIRGIKMPCNVEGCEVIIRIQPNGEVLDAHKIHIGATAIPLPEEHGRCIDADALTQKLLTRKDGSRRNDRDSDGWPNLLEVETVRTTIEDAPTIVPAEEGGEADKKMNCSDCYNRNTPVCKYCEHDAEEGV